METQVFSLLSRSWGDAFGNGTGLVLDEELTLFLVQHLPENFRELPQVVGGEHTVHMGEALFDPIGNLGFTGHTAAEEDLLPGVAALGMGQSA